MSPSRSLSMSLIASSSSSGTSDAKPANRQFRSNGPRHERMLAPAGMGVTVLAMPERPPTRLLSLSGSQGAWSKYFH